MPDDLLSPDTILAQLRAVMTEDACCDVEIIGWLYQFYIGQKRDLRGQERDRFRCSRTRRYWRVTQLVFYKTNANRWVVSRRWWKFEGGVISG